jgi:hypothetical protein
MWALVILLVPAGTYIGEIEIYTVLIESNLDLSSRDTARSLPRGINDRQKSSINCQPE